MLGVFLKENANILKIASLFLLHVQDVCADICKSDWHSHMGFVLDIYMHCHVHVEFIMRCHHCHSHRVFQFQFLICSTLKTDLRSKLINILKQLCEALLPSLCIVFFSWVSYTEKKIELCPASWRPQKSTDEMINPIFLWTYNSISFCRVCLFCPYERVFSLRISSHSLKTFRG